MITDGPFAETREYYFIDAKDFNDAIKIAEKIPTSRWGTVEVRPLMEIERLPARSR